MKAKKLNRARTQMHAARARANQAEQQKYAYRDELVKKDAEIRRLNEQLNTLLNALKRLLNSDPTGEIPNASDDDLHAAVNDENAEANVREQAASFLQARAAILKAEGAAA